MVRFPYGQLPSVDVDKPQQNMEGALNLHNIECRPIVSEFRHLK